MNSNVASALRGNSINAALNNSSSWPRRLMKLSMMVGGLLVMEWKGARPDGRELLRLEGNPPALVKSFQYASKTLESLIQAFAFAISCRPLMYFRPDKVG